MAVPADAHCQQCGSLVVSSPSPQMKTALPPVELKLEAVELPPSSGVQHVMTPSEEIQLAPAPTPAPPPILPSTVARGSVPIEAERDDVVHPPRNASLYWTFTNNTFEFPFKPQALTQWIFSSIGLAGTIFCAILSISGFSGMSLGGGIQGCVFAIAGCAMLIFSVSYVSGCLIDITVNAAYNMDKSYDWPNADYRERIVFLFRVAWVGALAGIPAAAIAGICCLAGDFFWPVFFPLFSVAFPTLLLAGLEADSLFWPVSAPIFRSVKKLWHVWAVFYVLTGLLTLAAGILSWILLRHMAPQMSIVVGPVWAAVIFIYGRLLGRLAWFILHKSDLGEPDKKTKRIVDHRRWDI